MKHCVVSIIRVIASDAEQQLKYRPHPGINAEMLKRIHQEKLGTYKGYTFWLVDGELIRDEVFLDFTEGGNPATYRFVPEHEVWIEKDMDSRGILPTMLHEYLEMCKMKDEGWTYDKAHTYASGIERDVRKRHPSGSLWELFKAVVERSSVA